MNNNIPSTITKLEGAAAADDPVANRYTPDAQERVARLRAMAAEFPDDAEPRSLTVAEMRLVRRTTITALEKAALFSEAAPGVSTSVVDATQLRDAIAFELAYGGLRNEALAMGRKIDHAIMRRKLKAVLAARGLYRVAKGFVTVDAGDDVRPHLNELKRSLVPRRKPVPTTAEPPVDAVPADIKPVRK